MTTTLLPPTATALERALADVMRHDVPLPLRGFKFSGAASLRPWLIHEYGLADIEPYLPPERVLTDGLAWSRLRGTAAALPEACRWLGLDTQLEEPPGRRWCELQLDTGRALAQAAVPDIIALSRAALPARSRLYRLYHDYDIRETVLDVARLDGSMLDDDSGVMIGGIKCSFGTRHSAAMPATDAPIVAGRTDTVSARVHDNGSWRLDAWTLDSEIQRDVSAGLQAMYSQAVVVIDTPVIASRLDTVSHLLPAADAPVVAGRTDISSQSVLAQQRWRGNWRGNWREPVPSRITYD